jgi:hypothetical protein
MGFKCYVTDEYVEGKTKILVPIEKRRVKYQKYIEKKDFNKNNIQIFVDEPCYGWEIVKEVPTTLEHEESLKAKYENNFVGYEKTINLRVKSKPVIKEEKNTEY